MGLKKPTPTLPSITEAGQCWLGVINWALDATFKEQYILFPRRVASEAAIL